MASTELQRTVCRLLATQRIASGESYVAGGVALNELLGGRRISRDIDLFHDTEEAVEVSWQVDRETLHGAGFRVRTLRERPGFVEAEVTRGDEAVRLEWVRDSAFRFFPLVTHPELGLTLHPLDLATNKLLALVSRREVRDWVDLLECDRALQPLGYLAWAACGKDPGFGPASILEHAARTARYSPGELDELAFAGVPPDPSAMARRWHTALEEAREVITLLPAELAGTCVLERDDTPCRRAAGELAIALGGGELRFHPGSIRGALPSPKQ